jgi:NADH-quinone oxidoreductase subunit M
VVGIFSFSELALRGAAVQMVAHGISVAALFVLVGAVEHRALKRGIDDFGGIAGRAPILATLFIAAALASAALPGTANFAGEFLLLMGIFSPKQWWIGAIAGLSTILTAVYLLRLVQRWFYGANRGEPTVLPDLSPREVLAVVPLLALSLFFGFYPKPISDQAGVAASRLGADARRIASGAPAPVAAVETKDAHVAR